MGASMRQGRMSSSLPGAHKIWSVPGASGEGASWEGERGVERERERRGIESAAKRSLSLKSGANTLTTLCLEDP